MSGGDRPVAHALEAEIRSELRKAGVEKGCQARDYGLIGIEVG